MHDQDQVTIILRNFFDHRRHRLSLLEYATGFDQKYEEGEELALKQTVQHIQMF